MRRLFPRISWLAPITVAGVVMAFAFPATSFADDPSGCDFSPNGTTLNCAGPLAGSTFAGGDGNLLTNPTTYGTSDWQSVNAAAKVNIGYDQPSGSNDNAFGQGTKEDDPAVTVVSGSIPPQKSDLIRFYQAAETAGANTFLYLAWERTNVLGNANMDFEINQQATEGFTGDFTGDITLNRSAGDLLITFDFENGGGRPVLGLNRWVLSATDPVVPGFATNTCLSANSFPCWGDHVTLNGAISEGAVNNFDAVTDPIGTGAPRTLAAGTFGETAINLTGAGVFGGGSCKTFASTYLKSRASSAFTSEVKDFVAPVPTEISNCGALKVRKTSSKPAGAPLAGAVFTVKDSSGNPVKGSPFTTNASGTFCLDNLLLGTYKVREIKAPNGYAIDNPKSVSVTVNSVSTCGDGNEVVRTFTDTPLTDIVAKATSEVPGATQSTITCVDSTSTNVGNSPQGPSDPAEVDANGLKPGTYTCTIDIDP